MGANAFVRRQEEADPENWSCLEGEVSIRHADPLLLLLLLLRRREKQWPCVHTSERRTV